MPPHGIKGYSFSVRSSSFASNLDNAVFTFGDSVLFNMLLAFLIISWKFVDNHWKIFIDPVNIVFE